MIDDQFAAIDLICRGQLAARRLGCRIVIRDADDAVRDTVLAAGLAAVLLDEDHTHESNDPDPLPRQQGGKRATDVSNRPGLERPPSDQLSIPLQAGAKSSCIRLTSAGS